MAARSDTSYGEKAAYAFPSAKPEEQLGGKPVFLKNKDIPSASEKGMSNEDMYKCLIRSVQGREIKGIQRIRGLWRLYVENRESRMKLITNGLNIRNANVAVYDQNPFITAGKENSLRLLIRDIPLSVLDTVITDELEKCKHKVLGAPIRERLRVDGLLTDCLTGNRIVYIQHPSKPLPRDMNFGIFKARVYHYGQIVPPARANLMCSRCLNAGHHRSQCSNPIVCRRCKQPGHLQQECSFETPPTSPTRDTSEHGPMPAPSPSPSASASAATPPVHLIEQLIASGRQAARTASARQSLHDNQTHIQPKITQYLVGDRNASQPRQSADKSNGEISTPTPTEPVTDLAADRSEMTDSRTHSEASSEESSSEDDGVEALSELSAESPELPKRATKERKVKQTKRKQKSSKKVPKKR
ncbi:uncharacterized protein [Diadema antillarum]|uniref:uncharacterized protein n=1 Tax=Diadema antillarum TaxID=105358 RepID=UPI003A88406C